MLERENGAEDVGISNVKRIRLNFEVFGSITLDLCASSQVFYKYVVKCLRFPAFRSAAPGDAVTKWG